MREILSLIFSYSFILYLILFLMETIFPGFVSNNFSLNYILIPVFIFGALSAFFPEDEKEEAPKKAATKFDLILLVFLSIGSFLLLFFKFTIDNLILKLTVSILSSVLTFILGLILLYFPDKLEEGKEEEIVEGVSTNLNWSRLVKRSFLSRIHIPVPLALLFVIITLIFIPKNTLKILNTPSICSESECEALIPNEAIPSPMVIVPEADPNIKIVVFNASSVTGEATRFAGIFRSAGYKDIEVQDYQETIEDVSIQFRESESAQADLIESIVKNEYLTVTREPLATTSAEIRVILGKQPLPVSDEPDFENENFDFFFQ